MTVIGSGYIGLELGQLFHNLGAEVTLVQGSKQLLKDYDPEVSTAVEKSLYERGIQVITGINYDHIVQDGGIKKLTLTKNGIQKTIESDQVLVATGRSPNTDALSLSAASVDIGENHEILMNEYGQTSNNRIYMAGDVFLGPQFVYVAAYEGKIAADNAMGGLNKKIDLSVVPGVIFTNPGVGTVGLTIEDLTDTMAPYLTIVEGLKLTALGYNNDISKLSCCAG